MIQNSPAPSLSTALTPKKRRGTKTWVWKLADWACYREELDRILSSSCWSAAECGLDSVDEQNRRFCSAVLDAASKAIPRHEDETEQRSSCVTEAALDAELGVRAESLVLTLAHMSNKAPAASHFHLQECVSSLLDDRSTTCSCANCDIFTIEQLRCVNRLSKNRRSPGPDGIPFELLRQLSSLAEDALLKLINSSWYHAQCPTAWRHSTLALFIYKDQPCDQLSSYRIIGLTNCVAKCAERLFMLRLRPFLLTQGIARRREKTRLWSASFGAAPNKVEHMAGVDPYDLLSKMLRLGFPLCFVRWSRALLCARSCNLKLSGAHSRSTSVCTGLPYGSILLPMWWLLHNYEEKDDR